MDTIQEAHEREGWEYSSYKHIKNLYDAIGKESKQNPATSKNIIAISDLLSKEEQQEALNLQRK